MNYTLDCKKYRFRSKYNKLVTVLIRNINYIRILKDLNDKFASYFSRYMKITMKNNVKVLFKV